MRAAITDAVTLLSQQGWPDYTLIKNLGAHPVAFDANAASPSGFGISIGPGASITWAPHRPCYAQCASGAGTVVGYVFGTALTPADTPATGITARIVEVALPTPGTTYTLVADPYRASVMIINQSPTTGANHGLVEWASSDTGWGSLPRILVQAGRILTSSNDLYFRGLDAGCLLEIVEEIATTF